MRYLLDDLVVYGKVKERMKYVRWIIFVVFIIACDSTQQRPQETHYWGKTTNPNFRIYKVVEMKILPVPENARLELHQIGQTELILFGNINEQTGLFRQKAGTALRDFTVEPIQLTDITVGSHVVAYGLFETSHPAMGDIYEIVVIESDR